MAVVRGSVYMHQRKAHAIRNCRDKSSAWLFLARIIAGRNVAMVAPMRAPVANVLFRTSRTGGLDAALARTDQGC